MLHINTNTENVIIFKKANLADLQASAATVGGGGGQCCQILAAGARADVAAQTVLRTGRARLVLVCGVADAGFADNTPRPVSAADAGPVAGQRARVRELVGAARDQCQISGRHDGLVVEGGAKVVAGGNQRTGSHQRGLSGQIAKHVVDREAVVQ